MGRKGGTVTAWTAAAIAVAMIAASTAVAVGLAVAWLLILAIVATRK